jgi:hypothetical protein
MPPLELLDVLLVSDWVLSSLFDAISALALALASILASENVRWERKGERVD